MVSKASDDLPDPDSPVTTISFPRGIVRSMFFRLLTRAPFITISPPLAFEDVGDPAFMLLDAIFIFCCRNGLKLEVLYTKLVNIARNRKLLKIFLRYLRKCCRQREPIGAPLVVDSKNIQILKLFYVMKNLDIVMAVVGGALVGASLGLLFAPKKGDDLRDEIMEYLKEKGVNLKKSKLDKLVDELQEEIKK